MEPNTDFYNVATEKPKQASIRQSVMDFERGFMLEIENAKKTKAEKKTAVDSEASGKLTTKEMELLNHYKVQLNIIESKIRLNANYTEYQRANVLSHIAAYFDPKNELKKL